MPVITAVDAYDLRFPTSSTAVGSDAMNIDGDHSAAYIVLRTDNPAISGQGFAFTIGRGNDLCVAAARSRASALIGRSVDEIVHDLGGTYRRLQSDTQFRWLGPDKGVIHLALAAVINAVWDLACRVAQKPLWRLLSDMEPEELVDAADLSYLSDALTRDEAISILNRVRASRPTRIAKLRTDGYPAYTTSAGWIGYSDDRLRQLCQEAIDAGYRHVKLKVGRSLEEDVRRCAIAREAIGADVALMLDANQVWDVPQAVDWVNALARFEPYWIEEPTSPDDILGHAAIRRAVTPIRVASGEHGMNRVLFKQLFQAEAIDVCQLDAVRLGGVNEILSVLLLAAKYDIPVCPHAGGVGLSELVQHIAMFDYIGVSGDLTGRVAEYVDHLHEHLVQPCKVEGGRYRVPEEPGYTSPFTASAIHEFSFPDGTFWRGARLRAATSRDPDQSDRGENAESAPS